MCICIKLHNFRAVQELLEPVIVFDQPYFTCEKTETQKRLSGCLQLCIFISLVSATNSFVTLGKSLNDPGLSFFVCKIRGLDEPPKNLSILKICVFVIVSLTFSGILWVKFFYKVLMRQVVDSGVKAWYRGSDYKTWE